MNRRHDFTPDQVPGWGEHSLGEAELEAIRQVLKNRKYCPCCGEPIMVGQEKCVNCHVYLWEVE